MFEIANPKTKETFSHLLEGLLHFLKALLLLGVVREDTTMVIGDEENSFAINVIEHDEEEDEDAELH